MAASFVLHTCGPHQSAPVSRRGLGQKQKYTRAVGGDTGSMRTYGQYSPIARASEILTERWTPIIVRNLMAGCTTFGEISAGAPGLSHSLLTQRLRLLERVGVIEARPQSPGRRVTH